MVRRIGCGLALSFLCIACEKQPPDCRAIRDMKECASTKGCVVSSIWVMGLPDAKQLPEHHQYECVAKQP